MKSKLAIAIALAAILAACSSRPAGTPAPTAVPVQVGQAHHIQAPATVSVSGSVVSPENPSNAAFLVSGKVTKVGPREGDYVKQGQVLAQIDPMDYSLGVSAAAAQAAAARAVLQKVESPVRPEMLEQARVAFERAQDEYRRMKQVYDAKSLPPNDFQKFKAAYEASQQQYEQARAGGQKEDRAQAKAASDQAATAEEIARKHLADTTLTAPLDGFVANRSIEVGDMASAGAPGIPDRATGSRGDQRRSSGDRYSPGAYGPNGGGSGPGPARRHISGGGARHQRCGGPEHPNLYGADCRSQPEACPATGHDRGSAHPRRPATRLVDPAGRCDRSRPARR